MRKVLMIVLNVLLISLLISCSSSEQTVVAKYGQDEITYTELKDAFYNNLSESEKSKADSTEDIKEFLPLYVNYKMKLRDAKVRGFDHDPVVQKEIDDYTKTVGIPYIEEKYIIEPGLKDFYEKRKIEKRIKHILIRTDSISTEEAVDKANEILTRIKNGENFEKLAYENTDDDFSRADSGDVYWLTAGQTVPEFDDAMYTTNKGEVYPNPIQTKYGVHILKVVDEQPRKYQIKARHILASFRQGTGLDTNAAFEKIKEVQERLNEGQAFYDLAIKYSDDEGSAQRGGDLGFFQRRMMVQSFDEAVFNLKVGEISDIVETRFGYHIIQLDEIKEYPSFEDEKESFKSTYQRTLFAPHKEKYLNKLKAEYGFEMNEDLKAKVSVGNDSLTFGETYWTSKLRNNYGDSIIVKRNDGDITLDGVLEWFKDNPNYQTFKMTEMNMFKMFLDYTYESLMAKKAFELREGNTEFAKLMNDYRNGLYIFKLQEEEIWNKLAVDTTQLEVIYEQNKDNFIWPDRVSYSVIYRPDENNIKKDYSLLNDGTEFSTILEENSKNAKLRSKSGEKLLQNVNSSEVAKAANNLSNEGDISQPFKVENDWYIVKLIEKLPSRTKSFDEAKSEVMGIWQEQQTKKLEEEYLSNLRKIYEPELYYDRLSKTHSN